jgi:NAD(P)-dependent dehydrogenase (short-subunit alcohol dehydrogenase family)
MVGELESSAAKSGQNLIYRSCNVSDENSVTAAFEDTASSTRYPIRGLVNCAGIGYVGDSISFDLDTARRTLDVNLLGSLITAQAAAGIVKKQGYSASFVFIASMSGYIVQKVRHLFFFFFFLSEGACKTNQVLTTN